MTEKPRLFYGWKVLAALFWIGATGPLARYGLTAFFPSIVAETGWSRSEIGLAQSITLWAYAVFSIPAGYMIDRLGGRKTILIGGFVCFGGWLLLATVNSLGQLYVYYGIVMGMAVSLTHLVSTQATSRKWFIKRAGLAGGIIGSAFAVGNAVFAPLITSTSAVFGWRTVSVAGAFIFSIPIILLAYFIVRDTPESVGLQPDGAAPPVKPTGVLTALVREWRLSEALKTPQFWLLFAAYSLCGIVINGILAHLVVWVADLGSTAAFAGVFVTLYNAPSLISRVGGGWMGDRFGKSRILLIGGVMAALMMLLAWWGARGLTQLYFLIPLLGIGLNLATGLYAPHLGDLFGRKNVGSLFAVLTAGWGLIGGLGPILWGLIYDSTGSYSLALLASTICYALALVALVLVRPVKARSV
jgi:MFS transporter, OFA family, oxalate/formate antiporter